MRPLALAVIALTGAACSTPAREAEGAIRAYDVAVAQAFRTGEVAGLSAVAGEREASKVATLVELKRQARLVLESTLDSLEITGVEAAGPDGLQVRAVERWTYQDRPLDPGADPRPRFVARMTMAYTLARAGRAWKVAEVRTVESEFLEPKGYVLPKPPR